ncbi:MAG: 5-formyltetrahydrofolate cyclo-ligase [Planctomycetaceae bacterium]|nr:5-formyltetrahydrofolate cyclo-ligase [Planctomycetaceae bacterium]
MSSSDHFEQKRLLRAEVLARRAGQTEKESVSRLILERLFAVPSFQVAETVLFYVDVRSEVRTTSGLSHVLNLGKQLIVPYCVGSELELFLLQDLAELSKGRFGILEPEPDLRKRPERQVLPNQLDFLVVPGVAFDRKGNRLGHGHGFYDRLLSQIPPNVPKFGLAFECQLASEVPTEPHDICLDGVVTEKAVYPAGMTSR